MATKKTILFIEVNDKEYNLKYSGGLRPDWDHLSPADRKAVLRHDGRIADALISMPEDIFERLAGIFRAVERCKRREAKKKSTTGNNQVITCI